MRLVNARFSEEDNFFWDERARSLEEQTTQPIQDHIEMGFSGTNGQPNLDSLIRKMQNIDYYQSLFTLAFNDNTITEERMQQALAQFVRSIQSFDSKYDTGRAQVPVVAGSRYLLDAVVLRPLAADSLKDPTWESLWASLTFAVPARR